MTEHVNYFVLCLGTLFAVLSPLATVPAFLAMTESDSRDDRLHMARQACTIACLVLIVFSLTGTSILQFFGISIPAFKIAGGILLLRASLEMLQGKRLTRMTGGESEEGADKVDISITPLGIPLLCGPVTIATGILLSARAATFIHQGVLIGTILTIYVITYQILRLAVIYSSAISEIARRTVMRLMGLLLAALAVQFVVNGINEIYFFPDKRPTTSASASVFSQGFLLSRSSAVRVFSDAGMGCVSSPCVCGNGSR